LDVFEQEPLPPESPLRTLDNVILTPHMVGHSQELMAAIPPAAVENVLRILRGEPPLYVKNPDILPAWRQRLAALAQPA
jgi:D-3-phosphoglycerate dehydrogenase